MKKDKRREQAEHLALESMDYILETITTPDFVEVTGKMGGDTVTYRIYDNGMTTER